MEQLEIMRAVLINDESQFGLVMGKVLSPSSPLQSEEYLRGRAAQLEGIKQALYVPGRHALIHGFRGVGKSSLAQTAAFSLARDKDPIVVGCDSKSTFSTIVGDIFQEAGRKYPTLEKTTREFSAGFKLPFADASRKITEQMNHSTAPVASVNDAVRYLQALSENYASNPVIVIDEFDQIKSTSDQEDFTNLVKQLSDRHIPIKIIFCGIAESVEALMSAHGSADRYFHTVNLQTHGRRPKGSCGGDRHLSC